MISKEKTHMTVLCFSVKEENCVLYETYQNSQHIDFFGHSDFLVVEKVTVTPDHIWHVLC